MYGGDRDFLSQTWDDGRPDSTGYNHGYTGDVNPVSYSRIAETLLHITLSFLTEFFCQEKKQTQGFNAFRDLKDLITGITVNLVYYKADRN
jgi:hypothetical protein